MDEAHIAIDMGNGVAHVVWSDDFDLEGQVATCGTVASMWMDLVGEDVQIRYSWYPLDKPHMCPDCFNIH